MITFSKLGRYGRLANQMFQYAALVGVAKKTEFDYGLNIIKTDDSYSYFFLDELFEINVKPFVGTIKYIYNESYGHFDSRIFDIPDQTDLFGYFQTAKYFEHCEDEIFRQFTIKKKYEDIASSYGVNFTSIHIRRGDYVNTGHYYVCDEEYVKKACEIVCDKTYFIFSDDIKWCKNNLKDKRFVFIEDLDTFGSFTLMSKARNNIIANSSFSWWAAYLNKNLDKKVVAPKKWYGSIQVNTKDLYIDSWIKI